MANEERYTKLIEVLPKRPEVWTMDDVETWLTEINMQQYKDQFSIRKFNPRGDGCGRTAHPGAHRGRPLAGDEGDSQPAPQEAHKRYLEAQRIYFCEFLTNFSDRGSKGLFPLPAGSEGGEEEEAVRGHP